MAASLAASMAIPARAQPVGSVRRIGMLSPGSASQRAAEREALLQELRALGHVEGRNLAIDYRYAEGQMVALPALARELVALNVEVIVAQTTPGALAARAATRSIPIVVTHSSDPVGSGLVSSLGRPGGNVTGLSMLSVELGGKRLAMLRELAPSLGHAHVMWNPDNPGNRLMFDNTAEAARKLSISLTSVELRRPEDMQDVLRRMLAARRVQGLVVVEDPVSTDERVALAQFVNQQRIPAVYGLSQYVDAGGLMSYGVQLLDMFRRSAHYIDKILKGAKPADLPVEQPLAFELVVNQRTARAIGATVPQSLLLRADRVIE